MKNLSKIILALMCTLTTYAQWTSDASVNTVVSFLTTNDFFPTAVTDDQGNSIVFFKSRTNTNPWKLYAQKLDVNGYRLWGDGVLIYDFDNSNDFDVYSCVVTSDGSGGAVVAWTDKRNANWDVFMQKIDLNGNLVWSSAGIQISNSMDDDRDIELIKNTNNEYIITWNNLGNYKNYVQKVNSNGSIMWTSGGNVLSNSIFQGGARIVDDNQGGIIATWIDYRNLSNFNLYAQRMNSNGLIIWDINDVLIRNVTTNPENVVLSADQDSGAFITWVDNRNGNDFNIYAQRINQNGLVQWAENGIPVCSSIGDVYAVQSVVDSQNNLLVLWEDERNGTEGDVYLQKINPQGNIQWPVDGIGVATGSSGQLIPRIVHSMQNGFLVAWEDDRAGNGDIYIQRVNSDGSFAWQNNGIALSTATSNQASISLVSNNIGGGIAFFSTTTNSVNIFAQNICANGQLGLNCALALNNFSSDIPILSPNPVSHFLNLQIPDNTQLNQITITDLTGKILIQTTPVNGQINVESLASGVYLIQLEGNGFKSHQKIIKN
ncbi:T9SS type A sorting domain-containing protein [Flavobacterium sp. CYK-55]|uniref:T9SS type A sorting domain-containing protein n=1 Tax=Flavobacterium sp. CYK-55 TaxID=2835529 RepID=UPI001BCA8F9E|nr:T9SS type A sorting domain-containing protein [Flavobacterium sp. CYK-55]MBS7787990.1 T9SS type A sorting domain-containing protein [Flavobacterium sp. CYK-55]